MVVERFNQISVNPKMELSFAGALKYTLRQDPDIIMLGEIRDGETAENAMRAALTGHMVLSTLHTNDSVTAITRLRELGVESYLIADHPSGRVGSTLGPLHLRGVPPGNLPWRRRNGTAPHSRAALREETAGLLRRGLRSLPQQPACTVERDFTNCWSSATASSVW